MAEHINVTVWGESGWEYQASDREYTAFDVMAAEIPEEYGRGWGQDKPGMTPKRWYQDEQTGLVVADVEKFEKWMRERRLT